jgi:hypothetical protein
MMKLIYKITILTLAICFSTVLAQAQVGFDYSQYEGGVAVGFDQVSGNVVPATSTEAIHFNFTYNYTPFTNFVFELQLGKLTGGDSLTTSNHMQFFNNDFSAYIFRGQLQLGEIMDYSSSPLKNGLKNLYISAGAGYIVNHITVRAPSDYIGGQNSSNEPFIPLRIGYDLKVFNKYQQPAFKVDIGYQYNYVIGDGVDGFSGTKHNEAYSQFTVGIKFALGGAIISYRKLIPY